MLTREDFLPLLEPRGEPAVSIFMPTHEAGPEIRKDPIRLKGLVRRAEEMIGDRRKARAVLEPARNLIEDNASEWRHMRRGLAIFVAPDFNRLLKLPGRVEEGLVVGSRFAIRPLLPFLDEGRRFYLLAVEQSSISLFEADSETLEPVRDPALETSFADIFEQTDFDAGLGLHGAGSPGAGGRGPAKFHALGEAPEDYKQKALERFAVSVAKAVAPHLSGRRRPLVLMAEPNLLGMLKARLDYPEDLLVTVVKSPNGRTPQDLHRQAIGDAARLLEAGRDKLIETFGRLAPRRASDDSATILRAAGEGRVTALLLDPEGELWGRWDAERQAGEIHDAPRQDSEDLIDSAARATLRHGGDIHVMPAAGLLRGAPLAAIFRY